MSSSYLNLKSASSGECCPRCASLNLFTREQTASNGVKHLALRCSDCGRFIRFVSQGRPIQVMPFGMHKGKPIKDLPADYLNFVLENVELKGSLFRALSEEFERRGSRAA
jgi:putative quorum-sensing-regulated virulence factor